MNGLKVVLGLGLLSLLLLACGGGGLTEPEATSTPRPLAGWDFEDVCRRGTMTQVPAYSPEPGSGKIHPIVIFERRDADSNSFSYESSNRDFPVPWVVEFEGDFTVIELVACVTRIEGDFVEACEYADDEDDEVFMLNVHNASYEVVVYSANQGEELGKTTLEAEADGCPMFHMFSETEEDSFEFLPNGKLQAYVEQFVEP
jgi:hypothetical protein